MIKGFARLFFALVTMCLIGPIVLADPPAEKGASTPEAATAQKATADKAESQPKEIQWLTYEAGVQKAKEENKPLLIDFTTKTCGWCRKMEREAFRDPNVVEYVHDNVIPVQVWGDSRRKTELDGEAISERALTQYYGVRGFPTFWFLESDGSRIGPAPGYKTTERFLPLIQYVAGGHYKTTSYEAFLKNQAGQG